MGDRRDETNNSTCFFPAVLRVAMATSSDAQRAPKEWMTTRLHRAAGEGATEIDWSDAVIRKAIEVDVAKCRIMRENRCKEDAERGFRPVGDDLMGPLASEQRLQFDVSAYPLRDALVQCLSTPELGTKAWSRLELVHATHDSKRDKMLLLSGLLSPDRRIAFQSLYDSFVRGVIGPHLKSQGVTAFYYQSFPCLRVIRPGEFSLGVHSDVYYKFSQASVNYWIPLTQVSGTNSLVIESRPGLEDWHSLEGDFGDVFQFWGAMCAHFTPENTTTVTRVSLDFRIILSSLFEPSHDRYSSEPGYYCRAVLTDSSEWVRESPAELPTPDSRVGIPFV